MENEAVRAPLGFAAIDPYIERNIPSAKETVLRGKDLVEWGERNAFPNYLLDLSKESPTLRAAILGTVDYIAGNGATIAQLPGTDYGPDIVNRRGDTIGSQVRNLAEDYMIYGGFAIEVIRSVTGAVVELNHMDIRHLRSNKENTVFYYCEKWGQSGSKKPLVVPAFMHIEPAVWASLSQEQKDMHTRSVVFVKNTHTQVYPLPVYNAALKACETERCVADFHLNAINNGFAASFILNFNNGVPSDEMKEEIEKDVNEKFCGHTNGGRVMLSWNRDRMSAATVTEVKTPDFESRFKALSESVRQQIATAFRVNLNLFGIPTESNGFNSEEYESAFKLYNRTAVKPVQDIIKGAYARIYGTPGVLSIEPFTLDGVSA